MLFESSVRLPVISTCNGINIRKSGLRVVIRAGIAWQRWSFRRVRVLSRGGFPPVTELVFMVCEWGRSPNFRGNVDDKLALIAKTGAIPEKGVGGHLPLWRTGRSLKII